MRDHSLEILERLQQEYSILKKIIISSWTCLLMASLLMLTSGFSMKEQASDKSALANYGRMYVKSDNKLYFRQDDGTTKELTAGGGGGDEHSLDASDGSPTDALYVRNDGNVGIGTTEATEQLHVIGTVEAAAFQGGTGFNYSSTEILSDTVINSSWTEWDLSSYVGSRRCVVFLILTMTNDNGDDEIYFRPSDMSYSGVNDNGISTAAITDINLSDCVMVLTGPDGKIDRKGATLSAYDIVLYGWM